jgi:hypothetical protein
MDKQRPYRVAIHGLPFFSRKLTALLTGGEWDVRYHYPSSFWEMARLTNDLRRCDLAYTWGGRISMGKFLWAARCLGKQKIVVLWSGSDVLHAQNDFRSGKMSGWVAEKIHWAVSPWLAQEVRELGVPCEYVQASFVEPVKVPAMPETFSVLAYVPNRARASLYGWDQIVEVARALPHVAFTVVGLQPGEQLSGPDNVTLYGRVENMPEFFAQASVVWRPVQHDGMSFMVLESLAHGRHVIYSCPFPACLEAKTAKQARYEIEGLLELHRAKNLQLNEQGIALIGRDYAAEKVRIDLLSRWEKIIVSGKASAASITTEKRSERLS